MARRSAPPQSQNLRALGSLWRAFVRALQRFGALIATGLRAAVRPLAPVFSPVTGLGRLVAAAALVTLIAGVVLGWVELIVLGISMVAALVIAVCFSFGRPRYDVSIDLTPRRVTAGERAVGAMTVRNAGTRAVLPTRMELPVGTGTAEFIVPRLAPGDETEELFAVPTHRRALIPAGPAISVRGDQLGLVRRTMTWSDVVELFVHPATVRLAASARGLVRDLEGSPTATITDSDLAFHALRTYEAGDDIRNVHWRSSARVGQLMVRQYQETRRSQMFLVVDAERSHYADDDEFELAVSAAASIAIHVIGEGTNIDAAWNGGRLRTRTPISLLDDSCRMALVDNAHATLRDLARQTGKRLAVPSVVMLVTGSLAPAEQVRAVTTLYGNDTEVLAVRAEADAAPRLGKIGAVTVLTLGALSELPGLLGRSGR